MIRFLLALALSAACLVLPIYYQIWANPYRLTKSSIQMPFRPEWEASISPERKSEVDSILSQRFTYLGRGFQTYAFVSGDGNYVLKLFRLDPCAVKWGQLAVEFLKEKFNRKNRSRRRISQRAENLFNASKITYDRLQDETGLLFVHLNPAQNKWPQIEIVDSRGFIHSVDPAKTRFVLQRKAEAIYPALSKALKEDRGLFERRVRSFFQLLSSFEKKGIRIDDSKMRSNFGFIGDRAVQIDFSDNTDNPATASSQIEKFRENLRSWLQVKAPDALEYLND